MADSRAPGDPGGGGLSGDGTGGSGDAPDAAGRPDLGADPDAWTVRLGRALRDEGVPCTVQEALTARAALARLDLSDALDAYFGLRSVFVSDPAHLEPFDRCFWRLWGQRQRGGEPRAGAPPDDAAPDRRRGRPDGDGDDRERTSVTARLRAGGDAGGGGAGEEDAAEAAARSRFSPRESLARRSFAALEPGEMRRVERVLDRLAVKLATRRSRRLRPSRRRGRVDLRRSLRQAVRHDGEIPRPARRRRRIDRPRIVLLCDVSGSMERYSRFLLRFLLAAGRDRDVETFVFSTRLTRLTRHLRGARAGRALEDVSRRVPDWSGGTRIGACLARFLDDHGRALLGQKTVVVIMSDGLERGDVGDLEHAMRGIRRRARKVIWLNPLLATRGYEPEARGMKAALPHVDELAPGHSLEALRDLVRMVRL